MAFTFIYRNLQMLELAINHVAPALAKRDRPKIWDEGCVTGPEAYTLAMLLAGRLGRGLHKTTRKVRNEVV